jgi:hypothetical protein
MYTTHIIFKNVHIKDFILFGPCAVVEDRIRICLLTGCVLNNAAWPHCRKMFYEILLLKLS